MASVLALVSPVSKVHYSYTEVKNLLPADRKEAVTANAEAHRPTAKRLYWWLATQAGHYLDSTCVDVLRAIVTRTYGFYKRAELISKRHFLEGVWKDNESICAPAASNPNALYRALNVLEGLGFITKHRVTVNRSDVFSLIYLHAHAILENIMTKEAYAMLRKSRKEKRAESDTPDDAEFYLTEEPQTVVRMRTSPVVRMRTTEYINKEEVKKPSCSVPRNGEVLRKPRRIRPVAIDCKKTVEETVAEIHTRLTASRKAKAQRGAGLPVPGLQALVAMWQEAIIAKYGFAIVPALTVKQYGIFKRIAKGQVIAGGWEEFLDWSVRNWESINAEHREWLKRKKEKTGEWSLKDEHAHFLGSDRPDLYCFAMGIVKLLKRYADYRMGGAIAVPSAEEVEKLKGELASAKKEAASAYSRLNKALSAPVVQETRARKAPSAVKRYNVVDPATDDFFDKADASLPDWGKDE